MFPYIDLVIQQQYYTVKFKILLNIIPIKFYKKYIFNIIPIKCKVLAKYHKNKICFFRYMTYESLYKR